MCLWASIWERHGWVLLYPNEGAFPVKQSKAVTLEKFYGNQRPFSLDELQVQLYRKGGTFFKGWFLERLKDRLGNDKLISHLFWTHHNPSFGHWTDIWIPFHNVSFQTADTPSVCNYRQPTPHLKTERFLAIFVHLLKRFHSYTYDIYHSPFVFNNKKHEVNSTQPSVIYCNNCDKSYLCEAYNVQFLLTLYKGFVDSALEAVLCSAVVLLCII